MTARSLIAAALGSPVSFSTTQSQAGLGLEISGQTAGEDTVEFKVSVAGAIDRPGITTTTTLGSTRTTGVRKNNADGLTWAFGDGAAQTYVDNTGSVGSLSVAVDDRICFLRSTVSGTAAVAAQMANFVSPGNAVTLFSSGTPAGVTFSSASSSRSYGIAGFTNVYTSGNANSKTKIDVSGTARGFFIWVTANASTTDTTFTLYVNGSASTAVITVTAGTTGFFEHTGTLAVSAGDELHWTQTNGAGGSTFTHTILGFSLEATSGAKSNTAVRFGAGATRANSATTHFVPIAGRGTNNTTSEAATKIKLGFAARISMMRVLTGTAGYDSIHTLRVNGADTALTVTQSSGASGWVEDATNSVSVSATDEINLSWAGNSAAGSTTVHAIVLTIEDLTPPPSVGSASGASTASAVSGALKAGVGSASGASTVAAVGGALFGGVGSAVGTSTAGGVGDFSTAIPVEGVGSASGTSSADGVAGWNVYAVGSASGSVSAIGVSNAAPPSVPGAPKVIAIEITAAIDATGTERTLCVSDRVFVTQPTDTPANEPFDDSLVDPGSIALTVFGDGRTGGGTRLALGEIKLANIDGRYDGWLDYGFDGRTVVIRQGRPGAYPADFQSVFVGAAEALTVTRKEVVVRLRDRRLVFDKPVLSARYGGTNVLPNGIDGTEDDLKGRAKPRLYGRAFYIAPPCVNTSKLVYQISDGAIAAVDAVYDRGEALTAGVEHANSAALLAATVTASSYDTCLAEGLFRLGSAPDGEVTADATQGSAPADRTAAQVLLALALATGVGSSDISASDVLELAADNPSTVGIWISAEGDTFAKAMDEVAASVGGYYAFDPTGVLRMGRLTAPTGAPVLEIEEYDVFEPFERRPARDGDLPAWSYTIRHSKVWSVQTSDLAGSVTAARRAFVGAEYRAQRAEDPTVKDQFLLAAEETVDTLLTEAADAADESERRLALHKVRRDFFDVLVVADLLTESGAKLMDVVQLTHSRFGLSGGRLFRLLGIRLDLARNRATLTLWG